MEQNYGKRKYNYMLQSTSGTFVGTSFAKFLKTLLYLARKRFLKKHELLMAKMFMLIFWVVTLCGGGMFLWKAGMYLQVHTALLPRRPTSIILNKNMAHSLYFEQPCSSALPGSETNLLLIINKLPCSETIQSRSPDDWDCALMTDKHATLMEWWLAEKNPLQCHFWPSQIHTNCSGHVLKSSQVRR